MINLHVLFADDDADIRQILALSLGQDPFFVVRGCASGSEALTTAVEWRPDLTLLDVKMRGMDGPAVLERLRADRRTAAIPVVFVTARVHGQETVRLRQLGAAGVIEKPFDPCALPATLRGFIPLEGVLAAARESFLLRLDADACALSTCRQFLSQSTPEPALERINEIAHALAGAGGTYGFAGISREAAALCSAVEDFLAGRCGRDDVVAGLGRLLGRLSPRDRPATTALPFRDRRVRYRYSAATA
ncbi:MAG TPA: response regulator [Xanthobacteraceae bacterium]|nr:response regulator [Xanthobacteraceae bacterium]